jgi:hypothetical protein
MIDSLLSSKAQKTITESQKRFFFQRRQQKRFSSAEKTCTSQQKRLLIACILKKSILRTDGCQIGREEGGPVCEQPAGHWLWVEPKAKGARLEVGLLPPLRGRFMAYDDPSSAS